MFLILSVLSLLAQPVAAPVAHATVTARPIAAPIRPGTKTTLVVDVVPRAGIHVYAPPQTRYKPVAIAVDPAGGVTIATPVFPPSSTLEFEGEKVRAYDRAFQIRVPVAVENSAEMRAKARRGETIPVTGRVTYQACDDIMCYLPKTVAVRWEIGLRQ